ncbi:hypothetical protein EXIGLDRAFT_778513 [Exidia glandulosa HHB12029]|uniref:Amino acid transporter transmembrane domain-containing protein n=1 Tax=Exidia glandulosa HHB12029 TaxID=1314781 RepID=A0A165CH79_EXIGL|nr:hypothetical protein EXIGLDRAFT_778513 [Exidia glandulosa HHB12029]
MAPQRTPGHRTPHSSVSSTTAFLTPQSTPTALHTPAIRTPQPLPRLVLMHDDDDSADESELSALPLPDELDDDEHQSREEQAAQSFTLSPNLVLLYLVSSSIRLGASLLSDLESYVSWTIIIPVMAVVALVFATTIQVWIRMARYVRKSSVADVVADAVVGRDAGVKRRKFVRSAVKLGGIVSNVVLCSVYMRVFLDALLKLYSDDVGYALRLPVTLALSLFASFCMGSTLRSKRVVAATSIAVTCYILALSGSTYLRIKGYEWPDPPASEQRSLVFRIWESTSIILFTFATPFILPLYSVLARPTTAHSDKKKPIHSFTAVSALGLGLALALLVPLAFVSPGAFRSKIPQLASPADLSPAFIQSCIIFLRAFAVATSTPSVMSILPTPNSNAFGFGVRSRRLVWRAFFLALMTILALLPSTAARALSGLAILLSLTGSYLLPVVLHVTHHHLRRPQAIIVPTDGSSYALFGSSSGDESESEGLLMRKEQTLQRRRLARRIVWDVSVWLVLLPLSVASIAWAGGRIVGRW